MVARPENLKIVDLPTPWFYTPLGILIPYPVSSLKYVGAIVEPLAVEVLYLNDTITYELVLFFLYFQVWITVFVSLIVVILTSYGLVRYKHKRLEDIDSSLTSTNEQYVIIKIATIIISVLSRG